MTNFNSVTPEQELSISETSNVHFYLTEHTFVEDKRAVTRALKGLVEDADVVFIETVGWQPREQDYYTQASSGDDKNYYKFRSIIRSKRGDNSFAETRLDAVRNCGKPVFIADAPIGSSAHRERQDYVAKGITLGRDLTESLAIIGGELVRMAGGIEERHKFFLDTVDRVMSDQSDSAASKALVIYGAGHTGLIRLLANRGYNTTHEFAELPVVCEYKSEILRKLEFGKPVTEQDLLFVFVQNLAEDSGRLRYSRFGSAKAVGQRAVAEAFSQDQVRTLHDLASVDIQQGFDYIDSMAPYLQQLIDGAVSKHNRLYKKAR